MKIRDTHFKSYKGFFLIMALLLISGSVIACAPKKENPPKKDIQKKESSKKELSKKDSLSKKESSKKETSKKETEKKTITKKHSSKNPSQSASEQIISLKESNQFYHGFHGMRLEDGKELTSEEIEKINLCFKPLIEDHNDNSQNEYRINPLSHFFTSEYEDVRQLDFDKFILYFESKSLNENNVEDIEQFKLLKKHSSFPFKEYEKISEIPVPIHRKTYESLDNILEEYAAIRISDLEKPYKTIYLESYDSFYTYESDFGAGAFECESAIIQENEIILKGQHYVLTLIYKEGKLLIRSFLES